MFLQPALVPRTLGAGDPRVALDKLYDRQLRLLMSVRKVWQQAERSRGELPNIPAMRNSVLPQPPPDMDGFADPFAHEGVRRRSAPPNTPFGGLVESEQRPEGSESNAAAALDRGDGGVLGPVQGGVGLPERLSDL